MKLALIGVGLIGGSFAKAIRATKTPTDIVGFDTDEATLRRAIRHEVIDEAATSPAAAVNAAEIVIVASPIGAMESVFRDIAAHLTPGAVVTDVGSCKVHVIDAARRALGPAFARFVPGHPIAGSEHSGIEHARADLFVNSLFVSTPIAQTDPEATSRVESLWQGLRCRTHQMPPDTHDEMFAQISHLPHLLAFAFVAQIASHADASQRLAWAGTGFRDFTRIASSNPALWSEICVANRQAIGEHLRNHRALLSELQDALDSGDAQRLCGVFTRAARARSTEMDRH